MFDVKNVEIEWAGRKLKLETGKIARQADSTVIATYGGTTVMCNVVAAKEANPDMDFFPLTVNYQEKYYSVGKIPGGFFKREARPTEKETLVSRLIDRPVRPLFHKDFKNETTPSYELTSKEFGFLLNNLLLVVLAVSILFGTIFPLIYEAITDGKQISVGAPYFEVILFPFALALGLLQGFALYLSWGTSSSFKFLPRLLIESVSVFLLILIILFILFDNLHLTSFATIFLSSCSRSARMNLG